MLRNWSEFFSPAEVEEIHKVVMEVLAKVGVRFPDAEVLDVFRKHGVKTDGQMVYLSEEQVMGALSTVPAQFTIEARNPERSVTVGSGEPVFVPGYGAPFLIDPQAGKRAPTVEDYRNMVRLACELPNQDMIGYLMVGPADVPPSMAHLHMLYANMVHSDKPFIGSVEGRAGALHTMEMASILFGEEVTERLVTLGVISSLTPLGYSSEMLHALVEYARHGQPVVVAAAAMAGTTAPITPAGVLVVQTAELLAGIALTQMIRPGTPVIIGTASTNSDMRTGALTIGSPELALMHIGHFQLARHYGLPSRGGGALTDSHIADARAGFESMHGLLAAIVGGADFVLHAAGILSSFLAFSYEKFVIDDEMCGMLRRFRRGIAVSEETLAYDVIAGVGPGGNYLMEPHTLKRCRTEFWQPTKGARMGLEKWLEAGRPDELARATTRCQELLQEHRDPPLDAVVARQLRAFLEEKGA